MITHFTLAIIRAKTAGFDGVQLHAAHGYLLSEFLSPYMNKRRDQWGGRLENRCRILVEIFSRARTIVGNYPILVKLNAYDHRKHGMRVEESVKIADLLQNCGCAAIEVSCGVREDHFLTAKNAVNPIEAVFRYSFKCHPIPRVLRPVFKYFLRKSFAPAPPIRLYNVPAAQAIKSAVSIPVLVVGGIRTPNEIEGIISEKKADVVSLCRPLILEPALIEKFKHGTQTEAQCISCNYCMLGIEEEPLRCYYGKLKETAR